MSSAPTRRATDRGYDNIKNNMMLAADPDTGDPAIPGRPARLRDHWGGHHSRPADDVRQRPGPGGVTTGWGAPTPENPRAVSNWPDFDPDGRPRAATVVIRKRDGGVIGT